MILQSILDALGSVVFAAPCRVCDQPLLNTSRIPICQSCLASFKQISEPLCDCCGRPSPHVAGEPSAAPISTDDVEGSLEAARLRSLCRLCRAKTFAFARARSWAVYNESLTATIMLLKYEEVTRLGDWFACRLAELFAQSHEKEPDAWRADVIVPVPLHPERRRERGYNQVEMIARPLAKKLGLPTRSHLIARIKPRPPRLVLSRSEHWESVKGAYTTPDGLKIDKLRVLLIDDVMTTGATLDACSRALRKAGAVEVMALTVARVVPKWSEAAFAAPVGTAGQGTVHRIFTNSSGK